MIEQSVPNTGAEAYGPDNPELIQCFRHEGEECPRCDGSGYRPRKYCAGCGEAAGSISAGANAGAPLVGRRGGPFYHVDCQPDVMASEARLEMLERMGG